MFGVCGSCGVTGGTGAKSLQSALGFTSRIFLVMLQPLSMLSLGPRCLRPVDSMSGHYSPLGISDFYTTHTAKWKLRPERKR